MLEEVFEILKRERMDTGHRIERAVMHDRPVADILSIASRIAEAIGRGRYAQARDVGSFTFLPNSHMCAEHHWCTEWSCRLGRLDRLARFAALWSDAVIIPSYFHDYEHEPGTGEELPFRYGFAGDLKALLALEPLLDCGLIRILPPDVMLCERCGARWLQEWAQGEERLVAAKKDVYRLYAGNVRVRFHSDRIANRMRLSVDIEGPKDLIPDGGVVAVEREPPSWLPRRVRAELERANAVEYRVPPSRLRMVDEVDVILDRIVADVLRQHVLATFSGTKYLTDRPADATFLAAVNQSDRFASWTDVLSQYLEYEMPILEGVPLAELVSIRRAEHDAFLVYRDTLRDVIRNQIAGRPAPTGREAQDMYEDLVRPSLNKMRAKVTSVRRSLAERTGRNVLITGGLVAVGVFSGLLPADLAPLVTAVGGFNIAKDVLNSLASAASSSSELRSENLYFLWKIGEKSARRRAGQRT